jgi:hypothetical protein
MARDGSGTYTRVSNSFSNPVAGTTISPTDADALFDDIETELTDSLSRSGKGGMSADLDMNNNDINEIKTAVFQGSTSGNTTVQATAIAGTTTLTLPAATDTLVGKATTDTLTNKTIDTAGTNTIKVNGNTLAASAGTATVTIPNSTDTLVGKATTDTLTNKTISGSSNTLSNVALTSLASQAAYTIVGNATGSSAAPTAVDIAALTTKASPAAGDWALISDQAAGGALKKADVGALAAAGSVSSIAGNTGAFTLSGMLTNSVNDLRVTAATKAEQETGSSTTVAVTPGRQHNHDSAVKAWVRFTGSTGAITGTAYNVSSVSRSAAGTYVINFTTAFANTNYIGIGSIEDVGSNGIIKTSAATKTTSALPVLAVDFTQTTYDPAVVVVVCYGRQ